jgi:hypothetical protein
LSAGDAPVTTITFFMAYLLLDIGPPQREEPGFDSLIVSLHSFPVRFKLSCTAARKTPMAALMFGQRVILSCAF